MDVIGYSLARRIKADVVRLLTDTDSDWQMGTLSGVTIQDSTIRFQLNQTQSVMVSTNNSISSYSIQITKPYITITVNTNSNNSELWLSYHNFAGRFTPITGDFSVSVQVASYSGSNLNASGWTRMGIMCYDATPPNARKAYAIVFVRNLTTSGGFSFHYDSNADGTLDTTVQAGTHTGSGYVRLRRVGNTIYGDYSTDGTTWTNLGSFTFNSAPPTLMVGIFVAPNTHNGSAYVNGTVTANFNQFSGWVQSSGTFLSPVYDISSTLPTPDTTICWDDFSPLGTNVTLETNLSLDGGTTWLGRKSCTNGGSVPDIANYDLSNARLQYRITLTTNNTLVSPMVDKVLILIGAKFGYVLGSQTREYYQVPITINNNPTTLNDYQVLVVLNTATLISAGRMRSDCGDIRFTDSDRLTQLKYWIEEDTINTPETRIWVKVPVIPANSTKTIYMYYGNFSLNSVSNGDEVFEFFEDFQSGTINPNKWVISSGTANDVIAVSNRELRVYQDGSAPAKTIQTKFPITGNFIVDYQIRTLTVNTNHNLGLGIMDSNQADGNGFWPFLSQSGGLLFFNLYRRAPENWTLLQGSLYNHEMGLKHNYSIRVVGSGFSFFYKNTQVGNTQTITMGPNRYLIIPRPWNESTTDLGEQYYSNIRVRKYTPIEPTISIGQESQAHDVTDISSPNKSLLSWLTTKDLVGFALAKSIQIGTTDSHTFITQTSWQSGILDQTTIEDGNLVLAPTSPIITIAENVFVSEGTAYANNEVNNNFGTSGGLWIGDYSGYRKNILVKLNLGSASQPILSCRFRLYFYSRGGTDSTFGAIVRRITSNWNQNTVTWNTQPTYDTSVSYGQKIGSEVTTGWHEWDITTLVNRWINGTFPNYGFALVHTGNISSNDWWYGYSTRYPVPSLRPQVITTHYRHTSGSFTSPAINIQGAQALSATISWRATTPPNTNIIVKTNLSLDGGQTWLGWETCTNNSRIPNIGQNTNLSNARLMVKAELYSSDNTKTPILHCIDIVIRRINGLSTVLSWLASK